MNAQKFHEELRKIEHEAREKIVSLVHEAQKDEGKDWNTDEALEFCDDVNWQNVADNLAELAGWIYDRVNGINRLNKKSVTKKIRKALGYTYP